MTRIIKLRKSDLDKIIIVETEAFIPPLQAPKETIYKRLDLEHIYLGAEEDGKLVGTLAFRYSTFPKEFKDFPKTFEDFSNNPNDSKANAMFGYSFGVIPEYRGRENTFMLLNSALELAKKQGMSYAVADGRCPSYNGSIKFKQERISQNPEFRDILDRHIANRTIPSQEDLMKDPVLAFYIKLAKAKPLGLASRFIPEDEPAGGNRVILYRELK